MINPIQRYRKEGHALKAKRTQKSLLLSGMQTWLSEQTRQGHVFPLTLEFTTGPWLYEKPEEDRLSRTAPLEREIGVFMERLYRYSTRGSERSRDEGWGYLCWPDTGGERGFLHYHGFLIIGLGEWSEREPDFKTWFTQNNTCLKATTAVTHAHLSAPVVSQDSIKTFNSYASRRNVGDPFWYKAGQNLPVLQWNKRNTKTGYTIWETDSYTILGKSPEPFSVRKDGLERYTCAKLKDAMGWCEADAAQKPTSF